MSKNKVFIENSLEQLLKELLDLVDPDLKKVKRKVRN
jgi:hypothetical protein